MRKQSLITIILTVLMSITGVKSFAYDIEVVNSDGVTIYYEWANSEKTELAVSYRYTNYSNYSGNVVIPESIVYEENTYKVTAIGRYAFKNCRGLTSVTIPNSVTSIGGSAFFDCSSLTSITIPNSVTSIGAGSFYGCSGLTSVSLPNSVTSIGEDAFRNCSRLTSITIPNSVTAIDAGAFHSCKQLTQLSFPDSVKYLEIGVCYNCENLKSVKLPLGLKKIGRSAFYGCKSLEEIVIPDSVKEIEMMVFNYCYNLKKIFWGKSIEKVDGELCIGCWSLGEVYISDISKWCKTEFVSELANPLYGDGYAKLLLNGAIVDTLFVPNDIDVIRKYTFYRYRWLKSIKFPESNIKVEDKAFGECRQLNSVYFGESTIELSEVRNGVFSQCDGIQYVVSRSHEPNWFWEGNFYKSIYSKCTLFIPTGTKEIYASTSGWKNFTKIKEIDVDDPAMKISMRVSGEGEVSINDTNVDENNIIALYDTDVKFSIKPKLGYQVKSFLINGEEYAQDIVDGSYIIHNIQTDKIVDVVFDEIPLAEGVKFRENGIYYNITETTNGFCLEVIYDRYYTYSGKKVIPEYLVFHGDTLFVERIGENAFKKCSIYSVTMPNTIKTIGKSAFLGCSDIKSITIPSSVETIGNGAFAECTSITSVEIPNSVKRIEAGAFYACKNLSFITFSKSLCDVGYDAFGYTKWYDSKSNGLVYAGPVAYKYKGKMSKGTSVKISNGKLGIAEQCFLDCTGMSSITIPESVVNIGESAFRGCKGLNSIIIPNSVTHISNNLLSGCSNITEINLGSYVEAIGSYAFAYTNVKKINLPEGLKVIGDYAFVTCSNLNPLTIPESVSTIGKSAFEGCSHITTINIPSSIQLIKERAFFMNGLNTIESHLLEPFPISDEVFNDYVKNYTTLIVPVGTLELYKQTDGWKLIKNIKEFGDENGLEKCLINQGRIISDGASVRILGGSMYLIQVYDVTGKMIKRCEPSSEDIRIELRPHNIYIIRIGTESYKMVL